MIAKRVDREGNDSFRRLAEYIAGAKDPGEKLDQLWIVNAAAGKEPEFLDMAIHEIVATQGFNTRTKSDKSYHLVVSFRDEKPSPEALRDIEIELAEALGFGEHQRVAATHQNTDNFHLHVAYSKIHPTTERSHTPHRDFKTLERVCRSMEKKHGLKVDLGREDKQEPDRKPEAARDMEAHSWEQSFFSYVQEHKKPLLKAVDNAKSWQDLHDSFSKYDLVLKKRGNGLVIGCRPTNQHTKAQHIKASALDRTLSKAALEKRFGKFQAPKRAVERTVPARRYKRRPLTRYPGQARLWKRYLGIRRKQESLAGKAFKTWREFLMLGAVNDPLAMAIIHAQKQLIETLTLQKVRPALLPKISNRAQKPKSHERYLD